MRTGSRTANLWRNLGTAILLLAAGRAWGQAEHKNLTATAWRALVAGDYVVAEASARKCIEDFKDSADVLQADLEKAGRPLPSGSVTAEARQEIQANGPLNDVATCYFILGEANRLFVRSDGAKLTAARSAYKAARRLSLGRVIETNGVVWVPADRATLRLQSLAAITNRVVAVSPPASP